ncbi:hypothetical protein HDU96_010092, partial [Phlyctochytrium bullatum]
MEPFQTWTKTQFQWDTEEEWYWLIIVGNTISYFKTQTSLAAAFTKDFAEVLDERPNLAEDALTFKVVFVDGESLLHRFENYKERDLAFEEFRRLRLEAMNILGQVGIMNEEDLRNNLSEVGNTEDPAYFANIPNVHVIDDVKLVKGQDRTLTQVTGKEFIAINFVKCDWTSATKSMFVETDETQLLNTLSKLLNSNEPEYFGKKSVIPHQSDEERALLSGPLRIYKVFTAKPPSKALLEDGGVFISAVFKEKFIDFEGSLPISMRLIEATGCVAAAVVQAPIDVLKMHQRAQFNQAIFDSGESAKISVYLVNEYKKELMDPKNVGQFSTSKSYIVLYTFRPPGSGVDRTISYFWQGASSKTTQKGTSAMITVELSKETKGDFIQIRVPEGKVFIIRKGTIEQKQDSESTVVAVDVRESLPDAPCRAVEVEPKDLPFYAASVCVITIRSTAYVWEGAAASDKERACGKEVARVMLGWNSGIDPGGIESSIRVYDPKERELFDTVLGSINARPLPDAFFDSIRFEPRLFACSAASGSVTVEEVPYFSQYDMDSRSVFILDAGERIFTWFGVSSKVNEKVIAMETAIQYADTLLEKRKKKPAIMARVRPVDEVLREYKRETNVSNIKGDTPPLLVQFYVQKVLPIIVYVLFNAKGVQPSSAALLILEQLGTLAKLANSVDPLVELLPERISTLVDNFAVNVKEARPNMPILLQHMAVLYMLAERQYSNPFVVGQHLRILETLINALSKNLDAIIKSSDNVKQQGDAQNEREKTSSRIEFKCCYENLRVLTGYILKFEPLLEGADDGVNPLTKSDAEQYKDLLKLLSIQSRISLFIVKTYTLMSEKDGFYLELIGILTKALCHPDDAIRKPVGDNVLGSLLKNNGRYFEILLK